jgi:hypothetical protein
MSDKKPPPLNWQNFDQVTDILEQSTNKAKTVKQLKDANEALGQLLGVTDNAVFQKMNTDQKNQFLQIVMDQYSQHGLKPADMAQKLLEGLHLRTPSLAPATPAPAFGLAPSGPGGSTPRQQSSYWPPQPGQQQQQQSSQWPPAFVPKPGDEEDDE